MSHYLPNNHTKEQLQQVEDIVNEQIKRNLQVSCEEMTLEQAKKTLDDMYGDWRTDEEREALAVAITLIDAIKDIRTEIQTKYDGIPYRNNQYDDAWIDALEWVLESVIDKRISRKENNESPNL